MFRLYQLLLRLFGRKKKPALLPANLPPDDWANKLREKLNSVAANKAAAEAKKVEKLIRLQSMEFREQVFIGLEAYLSKDEFLDKFCKDQQKENILISNYDVLGYTTEYSADDIFPCVQEYFALRQIKCRPPGGYAHFYVSVSSIKEYLANRNTNSTQMNSVGVYR